MPKHKLRIRFALLLSLLLAVAIQSFPVEAHAALVRSDPQDNAILATAPSEIRMWFNEEISPEFSSARLLNINGEEIKLESLRRDPDDPTLLIMALPPIPDGVYSVNWKALSEADGHFTQGLLVFGVGQNANLGAVTTVETNESVPIAEVVLRWLKFSFLALLLSAFIVQSLILRPDKARPELRSAFAQAGRRTEGLAFGASLILILAGFGLLVYQMTALLATLPEGVSILSVLNQLVASTRWGQLWIIWEVLLFVIIGLLWPASKSFRHIFANGESIQTDQPGPTAWLATGILAFCLVIVQSLGSHAASVTPSTTIAVLVDILHLTAVAGWVGSLLAMLVATLPLMRGERKLLIPFLQATWGRFGAFAAVSVGVIFATGIYSTGRQVVTPDALVTSLYGRTLIGKVLLVLAAGAFGLLNSVLLHPALAAPIGRLLGHPPGWRPIDLSRLPRLILIEAGLGVLVFLAVSIITSAPPARGPEYLLAGEDIRESMSQNADDMIVTLIVKPNLPGSNVFNILATSSRRPPPADVLRVIVRFTYLQQDLGTETVDAEPDGENCYRVGGNYFSLPGPWNVEVAVRRKGMEDAVAQFQWNVASSTSTQPVVFSNQPWEVPLTMIATGLFLLVVLVSFGVWLVRRRPLY